MRNAVIMLGICWFGLVHSAHGDAVGDAARGIMEKHQESVVSVSLVIKQTTSMMGYDDEVETSAEILGTVIDPDGLVVVSLAETDPSGMYASMFGAYGDEDDFLMESSLEKVNILRSNGEEIPAAVVLRDKYMDLAFLRPLEKLEKPIPSLKLEEASQANVFDQLVFLSRQGKVGRRQATGTLGRIQSVIAKPRLLYVAGYSFGCPAFTLDGKCLGIVVMRKPPEGTADESMFMDALAWGAIIVPAVDILESAKQVPPRDKKDTE